MKFSVFLKKLRMKQNLTQYELVTRLMLENPIFDTLNVVSYGRWERGITVPSVKKILLIAHYAGYDLGEVIRSLDLKLSTTQINTFNSWLDFQNELGELNTLIGYDNSDNLHYRFLKFDSAQAIDDNLNSALIDKIRKHTVKVLGVDADMAPTQDVRQRWQQSGNLIHYVCMSSDNHLSAHATWTLHPLITLTHFVTSFSKNDINMNTLPIPNDSDELFMLINSSVLFAPRWNNFIFNELIKTLLHNPRIRNVILATHIKDIAQMSISVFNGEITIIRENKKYITPTMTRLINISSIDLLSNHGVIDRVKNNYRK
ncbi:TPA: helix-turn-helix domain-containing protein [Vibrio parahaemolyticus]